MSDRSSSPEDANTRSQSTSSTSTNGLQGANNNARKHICPQCTRAFSTSGHLARHSRVHTGQRDHACPFPGCTTRCSRQDNLQQHYRVHLSPRSRNMSTAAARAAMARAVALQQAQRLAPTQTMPPHPFGQTYSAPTPTPVLIGNGYHPNATSPSSPTSYHGANYSAAPQILPGLSGLSPVQSAQPRSFAANDVRYSFPAQEYSQEELGAGPRRGSNAGYVGENTSRHYHPYASQTRASNPPSSYYHAHSSSTSSTSSTSSSNDDNMFPPSFSAGHSRSSSSSSYTMNLPTTLELESPPPIRLGAEGMWAPNGNTLVSTRGTWV